MGKSLIQQKRGKGSARYRAPSFRWKGKAQLCAQSTEVVRGNVQDIIHCAGHSSPLIQVTYANGNAVLMQAPEGIRVGQEVSLGGEDVKVGNVLALKNIPEGTLIFSIEHKPGDGGKFVKTSGAFAKIITKNEDAIVIQLPSGKRKSFMPSCRAVVGVVAGSGRKEKPMLKAGKKHFAMKSKNKLYPKVSGVAMNAVSHPFGGSSSHSKGRPTQSARHAPAGKKVGKIAPKRTGRTKR